MPDLIIAVVLGLVEELTEFIPVSSTGHLIVVGSLLGFEGARAVTFEVVIQLGAILAVAWLYRQRLFALVIPKPMDGFAGLRGWGLLALTTLPALILGAIAHSFIRAQLFDPKTVAIGLGAGGVAIPLVLGVLAHASTLGAAYAPRTPACAAAAAHPPAPGDLPTISGLTLY